MFTLSEIEAALDSGKLQVRAPNGKGYKVRRGGKTRRWVRDAGRFEIPCKVGLRHWFTITQADVHRDDWLRVDPDL